MSSSHLRCLQLLLPLLHPGPKLPLLGRAHFQGTSPWHRWRAFRARGIASWPLARLAFFSLCVSSCDFCCVVYLCRTIFLLLLLHLCVFFGTTPPPPALCCVLLVGSDVARGDVDAGLSGAPDVSLQPGSRLQSGGRSLRPLLEQLQPHCSWIRLQKSIIPGADLPACLLLLPEPSAASELFAPPCLWSCQRGQ